MSNYSPIPSPPDELVEQWNNLPLSTEEIFVIAAQWGADQELEACVNYIDNNMSGNKAREFRAIRRPKPPSLKELALEALQFVDEKLKGHLPLHNHCNAIHTISRALEQLPN